MTPDPPPVVQPAREDTKMSGVELIAAERERQVSEEGWTAEHDDTHIVGELADAAACLAATEPIFVRREQAEQGYRYVRGTLYTSPWPYEVKSPRGEWGPWYVAGSDRVRTLVKAGALIAAEIDRFERAR